jgi:uncharacterized protein YndB with AHSA1/START domain
MAEPIKISIRVPLPPEQVFDYLDQIANRADFYGDLVTDWEFPGPERGVGSRAGATSFVGGIRSRIEVEVIESRRPHRIVARNRHDNPVRVSQCAYTLGPLLDGGTHIDYEFAWVEMPLFERLLSPLSHAVRQRAETESMSRLAEILSAGPSNLGEIIPATDSLARRAS